MPSWYPVSVQEKGWMDKALMEKWIENVWQKKSGALLNPNSLLMLSSFREHQQINKRKATKWSDSYGCHF